MSDDVFLLIPEQPTYVPILEAQSRAIEALRAFAPNASAVEACVSEQVKFVDQGTNFEAVFCPACQEEIQLDDWQRWMEAASLLNFSELAITTPCCGCATNLNLLNYVWPAGFARFVLRAKNPNIGDWLDVDKKLTLEEILGCKLRQIRAHY